MGCSNHENYWMGYKYIILDERELEGEIEREKERNEKPKIYLISTQSIHGYINLIEKSKILGKNILYNDKKLEYEDELKKLFGDYVFEKGNIIYDNFSTFFENGNTFIIVKREFLNIMNLKNEEYK